MALPELRGQSRAATAGDASVAAGRAGADAAHLDQRDLLAAPGELIGG